MARDERVRGELSCVGVGEFVAVRWTLLLVEFVERDLDRRVCLGRRFGWRFGEVASFTVDESVGKPG